MQKQEIFFSVGHRSSFWVKLSFGIGHPPAIHQVQCICVGEGSRVPNLQTKFNYLDSFKSYGIFSDFVVPMWSLWSPRGPHGPHIIPVIPTLSLLSPCHPHSPQKVPMWSPWLWSLWSPWSPPHVVPVVPVIPVISTSSPLSSHQPPLSRRFPHHPQSLRNPLHPPATPMRGGGPESVTMQ